MILDDRQRDRMEMPKARYRDVLRMRETWGIVIGKMLAYFVVGLADAARTASTLPQIARGRIKPDRRLAVVLATICVLSAETDNPDTISRGDPPRRPSLLHLGVARRQATIAAPPRGESDN